TPPSCDDGKDCTTDSCENPGGCVHVPLPDCPKCHTSADCVDQHACTNDICDPATGACRNVDMADCGRCVTVADCDDGDPCSTDACEGTPCADPGCTGKCTHDPRPGCKNC